MLSVKYKNKQRGQDQSSRVPYERPAPFLFFSHDATCGARCRILVAHHFYLWRTFMLPVAHCVVRHSAPLVAVSSGALVVVHPWCATDDQNRCATASCFPSSGKSTSL